MITAPPTGGSAIDARTTSASKLDPFTSTIAAVACASAAAGGAVGRAPPMGGGGAAVLEKRHGTRATGTSARARASGVRKARARGAARSARNMAAVSVIVT
jgi:hypothetical protein